MFVDLWKKIKQKDVSSLYLLYGTESFLINETKNLLINTLLLEEERDFNLSVIDLEETSVEAAIQDAETLPFMGERRIVILKQPFFLTAEKVKGTIEHDLKKLEAYIEQPAPFTILVFIAQVEKLDERKKITKILKKQAEVLDAKPLGEKELKRWVIDRVHLNNIDISDDAIQALLQLSGNNLMRIAQEIDKLSLYVGESGFIAEEIVHLLVSRSLEQNIFLLIDKIVQRKLSEALRIFYDLLQNNEEPIKILSLFANQFRLLYQVKQLSSNGYGQKQMAGKLKVHPFRIKLAAEQAQMFSNAELLKIVDQLAEADYEIKTGIMDKRLVLELFIMKLNEKQS